MASLVGDEVGHRDGVAQAELVRSGQVPAVELVEAAIEEPERLNRRSTR